MSTVRLCRRARRECAEARGEHGEDDLADHVGIDCRQLGRLALNRYDRPPCDHVAPPPLHRDHISARQLDLDGELGRLRLVDGASTADQSAQGGDRAQRRRGQLGNRGGVPR